MSTAVILQARLGSTRLPGKVLLTAAGRSILEWVARSVAQIEYVETICVAVPESYVNDPVANEARRIGLTVVRGPEEDVLERFRIAAKAIGATEIIRVTTDCPLSDPRICSQVVRARRESNSDYACNNQPPTYPHGLDCEVMTLDVLERAAANATAPYEREHVTPWIKHHDSVSRVLVGGGPGGDIVKWRWTVDTFRDFVFFETIASRLTDNLHNWLAVKNLLEGEPSLHEINFQDRQR